MSREPTRKPRLKGWAEKRRMERVFPGGMVFFDLVNKEGDMLDSAVPMDRESARDFVKRVALEWEYGSGAPLPPGCVLQYSETAG